MNDIGTDVEQTPPCSVPHTEGRSRDRLHLSQSERINIFKADIKSGKWQAEIQKVRLDVEQFDDERVLPRCWAELKRRRGPFPIPLSQEELEWERQYNETEGSRHAVVVHEGPARNKTVVGLTTLRDIMGYMLLAEALDYDWLFPRYVVDYSDFVMLSDAPMAVSVLERVRRRIGWPD